MSLNMKNKIVETFILLSKKKNVDKITVKDLVEACDISRQTFYYHFQDITEVIEWSMQQKMRQALEQSLKAEEPHEALEIFVTVAVENNMLLNCLLQSQRREQMEKMLIQIIRNYLAEMIRGKKPDLQNDYAELEITLDFYAFGLAGVLVQYGCKEHVNIKQLTQQIYQLMSCLIIDFR